MSFISFLSLLPNKNNESKFVEVIWKLHPDKGSIPFISTIKRPRINNQIQAPELRVIDETGNNIGVLSRDEAVKVAREKELDLIEIAPTAAPPVAKIMEYGKYLYQQQKKDKEGRKGQKKDMKGMRLSVRTSGNDLAIRAKQVDKFLKKGYKIRIQLTLRGREKALGSFAYERLNKFLEMITEKYKVEQEPKRFPMGLFMIISKS